MPPTPHDALFKATFGQPDLARSEIELVLPAEVRAHLDLSTLTVYPGELQDAGLHQSHTDLLYAVRSTSGAEALVCILFEHQSSFDAAMPLRLLGYIVRIWERWLADHKGATTLPVIIPVVLHHGERAWHAAPELASLFDASPELLEATRPFVPHFRFILDDLSSQSLDQLATRALDVLTRIIQLALWSSRPFTRMHIAAPLMGALRATLVGDARMRALLKQVYEYILRAAPTDIASEDIRTILLHVAGPEGAEDAMSYADRLIEQGMERGRAEGMVEGVERGRAEGEERGRAEGMERGRAEGMERGRAEGEERGRESLRVAITHALLARKLGPSELARTRLASCTEFATLTLWLDRALTVSSEAEVFAASDRE